MSFAGFWILNIHPTLGRKQESEGLGDLHFIGIYRILTQQDDFLGISAGVKFPTGSTNELDPYGERFEPELQPGSGSYDYPVGIVYRYKIRPVVLSGNASYVIKTRGSQQFEHGDLLFVSMSADYTLNPRNKSLRVKVGLNMNVQNAQKDKSQGRIDDDSGETSIFLGPGVSVQAHDHISIFGNFLLPVFQDTGGVHQKLLNNWTAGAKIVW